MSWSEFLANWGSQPVLGGAMRDEREDKKLIQRRREIARSFVDWSLGNQQPLWDRLPEIRIPVLWIAGESDTRFSVVANEAAQLSDHFGVRVAPGAGHRVPWEDETWFAETIRSFL